MRLISGAVACCLLAACGGGSGSSSVNGESACDRSVNLLENPGFEPRGDGGYEPWSSAQHAGEVSFDLRINDGVLRIEKTGTQPWYTLSQMLPARELRGTELLFEAELRLDLTASDSHGFETGGGLQVSMWGDPDPVMGGDRLLLSSKFEHEPHLGRHDWTPVSVRVPVAPRATRLRVGFAHYAEGVMEVRNAAVHACDGEG